MKNFWNENFAEQGPGLGHLVSIGGFMKMVVDDFTGAWVQVRKRCQEKKDLHRMDLKNGPHEPHER